MVSIIYMSHVIKLIPLVQVLIMKNWWCTPWPLVGWVSTLLLKWTSPEMPRASMPVGCHHGYIVYSRVLYNYACVWYTWHVCEGPLVHACIKSNITCRVPCTCVSTYTHTRTFVTLPLGGTVSIVTINVNSLTNTIRRIW